MRNKKQNVENLLRQKSCYWLT